MIRQGDVLLWRTRELPEGLTKKDNILAKGEVTGHRHRLTSQAQVYCSPDGEQYAEVENPAQLIHENTDGQTLATPDMHEPVSVPRGIYTIRLQTEYDLSQRVRQVTD